MDIERLAHWQKRFGGSVWAAVFEALAALKPDTPDGDTKLRGDDIVVKVMSYSTRAHNDAVLEAHRDYIDIQMTIGGTEELDWFPLSGLKVKTAYNPKVDVTFYEHPGVAPGRVTLAPGTFVVLFPEDAHMTQLMIDNQPQAVKKAVIKLRAALVDKFD